MQMRKFEVDGKEITFVNDHRDTSTGFAHDTTMFINGIETTHATQYWCNRTWERYGYQTVMRRAVYDLKDRREGALKAQFMADKGYKRMTADRAVEFEAFKRKDDKAEFYEKLLKALE